MANFPGMSVTVIEGAGDANIDDVNIGKDVQLGITSTTSLLPALAGENPAVSDASNVYPLMTCSQSIAQTAVLASSDIYDYSDLIGKKVAAGNTKSVAMYTFKALLEGYGIAESDLKLDSAASSEYPDMFSDSLIDACHINGNLPLSTLVQIDTGTPVRLLEANQEARDYILEKYPSFYTVEVEANTYKGQTESLELLAYDAILIANKNLPEEFLAKVVELVTNDTTLSQSEFGRAKWENYPLFITKENTAPAVWKLIEENQ